MQMDYVLYVMRLMDMVDQIVQPIIVEQIEYHLAIQMGHVYVHPDGKTMEQEDYVMFVPPIM